MNILLSHLVNRRRLAYLFLDKDNNLISSGGDLTYYGLGTLGTGESVEDRLAFVQDGMFRENETVFFEYVSLGDNLYANVLSSVTPNGICVILLDVTDQARRIQSMQQSGNELFLCREQLIETKKLLQQALLTIRDSKPDDKI